MHDILQKTWSLTISVQVVYTRMRIHIDGFDYYSGNSDKDSHFTCSKLFIGVVKINLFNIFDQFKSDCA